MSLASVKVFIYFREINQDLIESFYWVAKNKRLRLLLVVVPLGLLFAWILVVMTATNMGRSHLMFPITMGKIFQVFLGFELLLNVKFSFRIDSVPVDQQLG